MLDIEKTKEQLVNELEGARIRIAALEAKAAHEHPSKEAGPSLYPPILDSLVTPVFVKDISGKYLECNKRFEDFLQLSREEIVGKTVYDIAPEEFAKKYDEMDKRLYQEGGVQSYEFEVRRSTGEVRKVLFRKTIFVDSSGAPGGLIGEILDITERKRAEEGLQDKEEQLRTLINAMPEIVCFKDGQGRWLEANSFDLELFQLTGVDYRGKKDSELAASSPFYKDAFLSCEASDEVAWSVGGPSRGEETIPRPEGAPMIFDVIKIPIFHQNGQRKGLLVVGRDITERKRAEEELLQTKLAAELAHKEWELTFDTVPNGIALVDSNYRIIRANRAMAEASGCSCDTIVGRHCYEIVHGLPHPHPCCPHTKMLASGHEECGEICEQSLGGTFEVTVTPIHDASGAVRGSVHVMHDITERKRAEKFREDVERIIRHDIKGPLSNLYAVAQVALADGADKDIRALAPGLMHGVLQVVKLVESKEKISQMEEGRYSLQANSLDPRDVLRNVEMSLCSMTKTKNVRLVLAGMLAPDGKQENRRVFGEEFLIEDMLANLVRNAVEAAPEGSDVTISGRIDKERICFDIHNLGAVPEAIRDRFFDKFATHGKAKGTGLGTYSAQLIAKAHGGHIEFSTSETEGTTLTVTLPVYCADGQP